MKIKHGEILKVPADWRGWNRDTDGRLLPTPYPRCTKIFSPDFVWVVLITFLLLLLLTGCERMGPIVDTKAADRTAACMSFFWSTPEVIASKCGTGLFGEPNQACLIDGVVYVGPKPAGFNDERVLLSMGHEMLHALGGEHK